MSNVGCDRKIMIDNYDRYTCDELRVNRVAGGSFKMSTFSSVEEAREFFKNDRFATYNGMQLDELYEDGCVCSMTIREDHKNAYGGVMGGVIFTLADFALAITSNNIHKLSVAQQVSVNYLNAPKGERLIARAKAKKSGRTTTIINVDVTDDTGRDVMQFTGTAFKL